MISAIHGPRRDHNACDRDGIHPGQPGRMLPQPVLSYSHQTSIKILTGSPLVAVSIGLSRHLSGRRFFNQNICAVVSGGISLVIFLTCRSLILYCPFSSFTPVVVISSMVSVIVCPNARFSKAFSTAISTGALPFFRALVISGNRFCHSYKVPTLIPIFSEICASVRPSRASPSSRVSPSGVIQSWYFPFAVWTHPMPFNSR